MVVGNQATFESAFTKKVSGKSLIKNACGTAKGPRQPQAIKTDAAMEAYNPQVPLIHQNASYAQAALRVRPVKEQQELGLLFGTILDVPEDILKSERVQLALYVMIESSKVTMERRLSNEVQEKLGEHAISIRDNYFNIYFENSVRKRFLFFSEPLVKYLWGLFRK
eukprot:CAMPEP_0185584146 /NCGR_PEP_ID=MMETSP0434-20130131/30435_1 /TAXON_ID=626734 ORGANISM="Favella taraikaensis, Strain Fe Narragansett Bay" /NCGR_SAMPLE_ID=MMETSP0434 /ASSEMBLY_ACC=CAM_ASM_000379 /LENGTH=165 /DNA_ID=CAMNT_0028203719 /DNA_START=566 /DNA_END=1063 /DNA_ORIENTATION=+